MPRRTDRPTQLADAAIGVLAHHGVHGLTHRTVDAAAGVPAGTTSNHFRTRAALLQGAAQRLLRLHLEELDRVLSQRRVRGWDELVRAMATLVEVGDSPGRTRYLATCELMLEATRTPALVDIMTEVRAASLRHTAALLRDGGLDVTDDQVEWLGSLLTGLALDRVTLGVPEQDATGLLDTIMRTTLSPRAVDDRS